MAEVPAGYSIVRVKRKRNAEALDALYIESAQNASKKARKGDAAPARAGIFRFAATVELDSFEDQAETQRLEDCITSLVRSATSRESPITAAFAKQQRHAKHRSSAAQARYRVVQDRRQSVAPEASDDETSFDTGRQTYSKGLGRTRPTKSPFVRIWDAEEERYQARPRQSRTSSDPEMDKFNEMLAEYLKVADDVEAAHAPSARRSITTSAEPDDESSYVYDVYYRAKTPTPGEESLESYGTLSGLKASDLVGDLSGESDSEAAMTDDEDSNGALTNLLRTNDPGALAEEDFYRNDYPEGEESSEEEEESRDPWDSAETDDE